MLDSSHYKQAIEIIKEDYIEKQIYTLLLNSISSIRERFNKKIVLQTMKKTTFCTPGATNSVHYPSKSCEGFETLCMHN